MYQRDYHTSDDTITGLIGSVMSLFEVPIRELSLRQLRDTIQNLQVDWIKSSCVEMAGMKGVVDACFHRFGVLALESAGGDVMDDQVCLNWLLRIADCFAFCIESLTISCRVV